MNTFTLHHGDCLAGMATLADKSVDVVITDPPYSEHVHSKLGREVRGDGATPRGGLFFGHADTDLRLACAREFARVARRWIVVFSDVDSVALWRDALVLAGADHVRPGAWVKTDPMPQMTGDRPAIGMEGIEIAHARRPPRSGRMRWNGGGRPATWTGPVRDEGVNRGHPTQKPVWLMDALVRDFTDPGELVLDPFAGSGTTGVACIRNGRRFVGWEQDAKYHALATKRLAATREQFSLFGGEAA